MFLWWDKQVVFQMALLGRSSKFQLCIGACVCIVVGWHIGFHDGRMESSFSSREIDLDAS